MSRFQYRGVMRPLAGDATQDFEVDWQFVNADDVPGFDYPIAFGSSRFDPDPLDLGNVGEIRQTFYPAAKTRLPGWLRGEHFCGTQEQWQEGYPLGTPFPPSLDGVPVCCQRLDTAPFDYGFEFGFES
jgi:hypothetical protein